MISNTLKGSVAQLGRMSAEKPSERKILQTSGPKELSKVESIKEQIKNGTYEVNIQKTAEAIVRDLI